MISVRFPYDFRTVLNLNVDESQSKHSYVVGMNCKYVRRGRLLPPMSKHRSENRRLNVQQKF